VRDASCDVGRAGFPDRYDDDGMAKQHELEMAKGERGSYTTVLVAGTQVGAMRLQHR
jgi:hypothetical protein